MDKSKDLEKIKGISAKLSELLELINIYTPEDLINTPINKIFEEFEKLKNDGKISYQVSTKAIEDWVADAKTGEYKYHQTNQLYYSLMERNFNKILRIILFKYLIVEKTEVPDEINFTISKVDNDLFKAIFDDMKQVRLVNKEIDKWVKTNKSRIDRFWTKYELIFKKGLSLNQFKDFYHDDNYDRECEYCGIKESDIGKLREKGEIKTKRFYSRGKKMEVDKINPNGDYTEKNIVLSCYWCNNAKTDEFSYDEFVEIGQAIRKVWDKRK